LYIKNLEDFENLQDFIKKFMNSQYIGNFPGLFPADCQIRRKYEPEPPDLAIQRERFRSADSL